MYKLGDKMLHSNTFNNFEITNTTLGWFLWRILLTRYLCRSYFRHSSGFFLWLFFKMSMGSS